MPLTSLFFSPLNHLPSLMWPPCSAVPPSLARPRSSLPRLSAHSLLHPRLRHSLSLACRPAPLSPSSPALFALPPLPPCPRPLCPSPLTSSRLSPPPLVSQPLGSLAWLPCSADLSPASTTRPATTRLSAHSLSIARLLATGFSLPSAPRPHPERRPAPRVSNVMIWIPDRWRGIKPPVRRFVQGWARQAHGSSWQVACRAARRVTTGSSKLKIAPRADPVPLPCPATTAGSASGGHQVFRRNVRRARPCPLNNRGSPRRAKSREDLCDDNAQPVGVRRS
jgi:hypothetical protein